VQDKRNFWLALLAALPLAAALICALGAAILLAGKQGWL
jgi:hypothetical protein